LTITKLVESLGERRGRVHVISESQSGDCECEPQSGGRQFLFIYFFVFSENLRVNSGIVFNLLSKLLFTYCLSCEAVRSRL